MLISHSLSLSDAYIFSLSRAAALSLSLSSLITNSLFELKQLLTYIVSDFLFVQNFIQTLS